jgi:hypothetical protein
MEPSSIKREFAVAPSPLSDAETIEMADDGRLLPFRRTLLGCVAPQLRIWIACVREAG